MVFDGRAHLVDLTAKAELPPDERESGPPSATLRTSVDLTKVDEEAAPAPIAEGSSRLIRESLAVDDDAAAAPTAAGVAATGTAAAQESAPPEDQEPVMPVWAKTPPAPRRGVQWAYAVLAVVLMATFSAQAIFHFRHVLAAEYPRLRPHLATACAAIGCTVDPLRNRDEITIESHDLQADPAHQGLLILQTTLRNQAKHPIAFPHLELELDDRGGQPIVRRVFPPVEYAGGAADFANGIPANAEWNVKIFLDASSVNAGGYNLYLFYP